MSDTEDLSQSCCLNPKCDHHGRRNAGNLLVVDRNFCWAVRKLRLKDDEGR